MNWFLLTKGYVGCAKTITPVRGNHKTMAQEDLDLNKAFSKTRIHMEHAFGKMKIFRILKGPWRGSAKDLGRIFYTLHLFIIFYIVSFFFFFLQNLKFHFKIFLKKTQIKAKYKQIFFFSTYYEYSKYLQY